MSPVTPRVLFNRDSVGAFRAIPTSKEAENGEKETTSVGNYRDVQVLGDCDAGILQFCRELGWEEELMQLAGGHEKT